MTIRTVTMSPGFDHVVHVDQMSPGGVARVLAWDTLAAGKGVNVARAASELGAECVAYSLVGESDRNQFVDSIAECGASAEVVAVPGRTRQNLTLAIGESDAIAAHAVGQRLSANDHYANRLIASVVEQTQPGDIVSFNGALPQGVRPEIWSEAALAVTERKATVVADVQGAALIAVLESGVAKMAKPNEEEAQELPISSEAGNSAAAVFWMRDQGVADPIVSVGAGGVLHLVDGSVTRSWCTVAVPRVVVGAGDAFVAGYCATLDNSAVVGHDPIDIGLASAAVHVCSEQFGDRPRAVLEVAARVQHEPFRVDS